MQMSNDNLFNCYFSDPFGFSCNPINRNTFIFLSVLPYFQCIKNSKKVKKIKNKSKSFNEFLRAISFNNEKANKVKDRKESINEFLQTLSLNNEKASKDKNKRKSFNEFLNTFPFLNKSNNSSSIKHKNSKSSLESNSGAIPASNIEVISNEFINSINDKANKVELKRYSCSYSDLLGTQIYQPKLEVEEESTHYHIRVNLPDVKRKEIYLKFSDDNIIIYGERKRKINKNATFIKFNRIFTIPEDTSVNELETNYKNGILDLIFQKQDSKKKK